MNHRDTMNTGRRSRNRRSAAVSAEDQPQRPRILADIRWNPRHPVRPTCCGWCSAHTAALREKSSCHARILQSCSTAGWSRDRTTWERHSRAGGFPCSVRGRTVPVPEGRRRRLAGGKSATADAAPGSWAEWLCAPAGHRRKGPGCRPITGGTIGPRRRVVARMLRGVRRQKLLRCPAGACAVRRGNRGPRPLARACPRLISCGVPPGRNARRRRRVSDGLMVANATASPPRRQSLPSHSLAPNSPAQPGSAPERLRTREGARNFERRGSDVAAAAGPRRTQPRSVGCGFTALCSLCLCGPLGVFRCAATTERLGTGAKNSANKY